MNIYFPTGEFGGEAIRTSSWPVTVDGVRLDSLAWNVSTLNGREYIPGIRGTNIQVPGRHGSLFNPNKKFDEGKFILQMWVQGCDNKGEVPTNTYNEFRKNLDSLKLLFTKRGQLLDVRRKDGAGNERRAYCEVEAAIDPEVYGVNPAARFAVELSIPAVFWESISQSTELVTGPVSGTDYEIGSLTASTAINEDLEIIVDGPCNNPKLTDVGTGHWVQLNKTIPAGQQWVLNTTNWTSQTGTLLEFTGTGTDEILNTAFGGPHSPRYFALSPNYIVAAEEIVAAGPVFKFEATGGVTGATQIRIRGRKKFL